MDLVVPDAALQALMDALAEADAMLSQGHLEEEVQNLLREHIELLREALRVYPIRGAEAFTTAMHEGMESILRVYAESLAVI